MATLPFALYIGGNLAPASSVSLDALQLDSRGPHLLSFREFAKYYEQSYNEGDTVLLEYPQNELVFAGRITDSGSQGRPGAEQIVYTAQSHRGMARNVQVHRNTSDETEDPLDEYPERIYNADATDPDAAYNKNPTAASMTVGEILADLFDAHDTDLRSEGSVSGTGYVQADLDLLGIRPTKLVLSGLSFEEAVTQVLLEQGPAYAIDVTPEGVWRFYDARNSGVNTSVETGTDLVESVNLKRNVRDRYTAVEIFGEKGRGENPIRAQVGVGRDPNGNNFGAYGDAIEKVWDDNLEGTWTKDRGAGADDSFISSAIDDINKVVGKSTANWTPNIWANGIAIFPAYSHRERFTILSNTANQLTLETLPSGLPQNTPVYIRSTQGTYADVFRLFQIVDPALREIVAESIGELDCCPHVTGYIYNAAGVRSSTQIVSVRLEGDGTFRTEGPLVRSNGDGTFRVWEDWKFTFCYRDTSAPPIKVRYPAAGYEGEAHGAPWGIQRTKQIIAPEFDELTDSADFGLVAQEMHKVTSSVGVSGDVRIASLDLSAWLSLRQNINLTHADGATGWDNLRANLTAVTLDLAEQRTTLHLSESGSTNDIDYGAILDQIRAERNRASAVAEANKVTSFINCRETAKGRSGTAQQSDDVGDPDVVEQARDIERLHDGGALPGYRARSRSIDEHGQSGECKCDDDTNACETLFDEAQQSGVMICAPDGQRGLIVQHPPKGDNSLFCFDSQIAGSEIDAPGEMLGASGIYFPFACAGSQLGASPDGKTPGDNLSGDCNTWRRIVSVEPSDVDFDPATGDSISVAQFAILQAAAADSYMQHNEDSHCCLDNRIATVQTHVWGGGGSDYLDCDETILETLGVISAAILELERCVENIHYCPGPVVPECNVPFVEPQPCGPCRVPGSE